MDDPTPLLPPGCRLVLMTPELAGAAASVICATSATWKPAAPEIAQEETTLPTHIARTRWLAFDGDEPVAMATAQNDRYVDEPTRFQVAVRVVPDRCGQGIGRALAGQLRSWLAERRVETIIGTTEDGDARAERFATANGFVAVERRVEQVLDPADPRFDPGRFADASARTRALGVRIMTLDELAAFDPNRQRAYELYELDVAAMADEPTQLGGADPTFDDWRAEFLDGRPPEGVLVAVHDAELIGACIHWPEPEHLLIATTCVARAWRHKGVAIALKLASVEHARRDGRLLRVFNAADNAPILAINAAFGFRPTTGFTRWRRVVDSDLS